MTLYTVVKATGYLKYAFKHRTYRCIGFKSFKGVMYALLDSQYGFIWFKAENLKSQSVATRGAR